MLRRCGVRWPPGGAGGRRRHPARRRQRTARAAARARAGAGRPRQQHCPRARHPHNASGGAGSWRQRCPRAPSTRCEWRRPSGSIYAVEALSGGFQAEARSRLLRRELGRPAPGPARFRAGGAPLRPYGRACADRGQGLGSDSAAQLFFRTCPTSASGSRSTRAPTPPTAASSASSRGAEPPAPAAAARRGAARQAPRPAAGAARGGRAREPDRAAAARGRRGAARYDDCDGERGPRPPALAAPVEVEAA